MKTLEQFRTMIEELMTNLQTKISELEEASALENSKHHHEYITKHDDVIDRIRDGGNRAGKAACCSSES